MVCEENYSKIRPFEVLKALYELNKKATLNQLEQKLREICNIPSHVSINYENLNKQIKLLRDVKLIYKLQSVIIGEFYLLEDNVPKDPLLMLLKKKS